ncbi:MAG: hypothetical protein FWB96_00405 [Defluviitaleaceae bacterium]|nr:hypothetical protein [Defluviitaleaceae bacterium]MCL2261827.1 hypothetical protein [Defluviitaleaceae bacterium]
MNISQLQQEHDKHNEIYMTEKADVFSGVRVKRKKWQTIANERLDKLNEAIADISEITGNYVEAVDLFVSFFDDIIIECAIYVSRRAEIEEKIIALCKKALEKPTADNTRNAKDEHVTAMLIDGLNEKPSAEASKKMTEALLHDTNPLRLGLTLYMDFCEKNSLFTDVNSLDYLKLEAVVRQSLISDTGKETIPKLEKLLSSPVDCPEKYMLTALNFFFLGFEKDAINALDIGLKKFQGNERLAGAKKSIEQ